MLPCCVHPVCVCVCVCLDGRRRAVTHKLVIQVHHASTTHSFSSAEYGIKIGIVAKAHDKFWKPGDLEHEDVLGREEGSEKEEEKEEVKERGARGDKGGVKWREKRKRREGNRRRVERGEEVEEEKYGVGKVKRMEEEVNR